MIVLRLLAVEKDILKSFLTGIYRKNLAKGGIEDKKEIETDFSGAVVVGEPVMLYVDCGD